MSKHNSKSLFFHNPKSIFDPTPYGFSQSVACPSNGGLVFISGQGGVEDLEHTVSDDFRRQVQFALKNVCTVLSEHGLKPEHTLKVTVLIVDHSKEKLIIWSEEIHKVWDAEKLPSCTLIPVPALAQDGMMFEIDAVAFKADLGLGTQTS